MSQTTTPILPINIQENIQCSWCGRRTDDVSVTGAASLYDARKAALDFFRNDKDGCDDEGITLDEGQLITWEYDDPKDPDWQDHYVFRAIDAWQPDMREWWEK